MKNQVSVGFLSLTVMMILSAFAVQPGKKAKLKMPKGQEDLQLGMTQEALKSLKPGIIRNKQEGYPFRIVFTEKIPEEDIETITYYLDAEAGHPLYEIIFTFKKDVDLKTFAAELLGPPNHGSVWLFPPKKEGAVIRVWVHQQSLVYAADLPGTEWEGDARFKVPEKE